MYNISNPVISNLFSSNFVTSYDLLDVIVFIGRFQPFHLGHAQIIKTGLKLAKQMIILIGSEGPNLSKRTLKNPWFFEERKSIINHWLYEFRKENCDISTQSLIKQETNQDYIYENKIDIIIKNIYDVPGKDEIWVKNIVNQVNHLIITQNTQNTQNAQSFIQQDVIEDKSTIKATATIDTKISISTTATIAIIGHFKDASSYYLPLFPQWQYIEVPNYCNISATDIRRELFLHKSITPFIKQVVPESLVCFLNNFIKSDAFIALCKEYDKYKTL